MAARGTSQLVELITMTAAHFKLSAIVQDQEIIAPLQRSELLDAIEVHDRTAVNAAKLPGIKPLLDAIDRGPNAERLSGGVNLYVVRGGRQVFDLGYSLKEDSVLGTDDDLLRVFPSLLYLGPGMNERSCS